MESNSDLVDINEIDVICDIRDIERNIRDAEDLYSLWDQFLEKLIDRPVAVNQTIDIDTTEGNIALYILETYGSSLIEENTKINIVDLWRSPTIRYPCKECIKLGQKEYGPFRCVECEKEKKPERLCSEHRYLLKNALSAYCPEHIPSCECKDQCKHRAIFICDRCKRKFGDHFENIHPKDDSRLLCDYCYSYLFERCEGSGCNRVGKSKCAFIIGNGEYCNKPLCTRHSHQLKIWFAHNRGITLCSYHASSLSTSDPEQIITMMLFASPPTPRIRFLLFNPYRLRRIINRKRQSRLSFTQIRDSLLSTQHIVKSINYDWFDDDNPERLDRNIEWINKNYQRMIEEMEEVANDVLNIEDGLKSEVISYYTPIFRFGVNNYIYNIEIVDLYKRPGKIPRYIIELQVDDNSKGRIIGRGGEYIKGLRARLQTYLSTYFNYEVDVRIDLD